jgi:hypothetical protein
MVIENGHFRHQIEQSRVIRFCRSRKALSVAETHVVTLDKHPFQSPAKSQERLKVEVGVEVSYSVG